MNIATLHNHTALHAKNVAHNAGLKYVAPCCKVVDQEAGYEGWNPQKATCQKTPAPTPAPTEDPSSLTFTEPNNGASVAEAAVSFFAVVLSVGVLF